MYNSGPGIGGIVIVFAVVVGLFFLVRSILIWYWKIDVLVQNQEDQKRLMRDQRDLLEKIYRLQSGEKVNKTTDSQGEIERKANFFDESQIKDR
jgi:hypothetical protein